MYGDLERKFKTVLFVDDMIVYIIIGKKSTKKPLLKLRSDYGKVAECKINMQMSIVFLYTNNKQMKFEMKNAMSIALATAPPTK